MKLRTEELKTDISSSGFRSTDSEWTDASERGTRADQLAQDW